MALELQLPILPITIVGTKDILPNGTMDLMPGRAHLIIHEPISMVADRPENAREIVKATRNLIELTRERIASVL